MFRRRRRHPWLKPFGPIILFIGLAMLLYIIPFKIWVFIIANLFIVVGFLLTINN